MATGLDQALGPFADTLVLRSRRAEVLAANLANSDTPGYKARDLDFATVLGGFEDRPQLSATHGQHLRPREAEHGAQVYRVPIQPAIDGNTVEPQVEKAEFMKNSTRYFADLVFLNGRIQGIIRAIRGE
jgi:flagellar basal-body rod protein FlgB